MSPTHAQQSTLAALERDFEASASDVRVDASGVIHAHVGGRSVTVTRDGSGFAL